MKIMGKHTYFLGIEVLIQKRRFSFSEENIYLISLKKLVSWDEKCHEFLLNKIIELEGKRTLL